jgi:hypothetical protein
LVTNPPYSGEHKVKLTEYLLQHYISSSNTQEIRARENPFLLLLPVYIASKSYWKSFVDGLNQVSKKEGVFDMNRYANCWIYIERIRNDLFVTLYLL